MSYDISDMENDLTAVARSLHLAYRRCKYATDRWDSGLSAQIPNSGDTAKYHTIMARLAEFVANLEANTNAKLRHILALSDLRLPGDN